MPTYVYRNLKTNQTFELKQSMKDDALTSHPETGEPVKRLVSAPAIAFKGSGFYANDSRPASKTSTPSSAPDSSKTESNSADSASSPGSSAASSPKTEAPEAADKSSAASTSTNAAATPSSSGGSGQ